MILFRNKSVPYYVERDICEDLCMTTLIIATSPITIPCAIIGYTGYIVYEMYINYSIKQTVTPIIHELSKRYNTVTPIFDKIALFMWSIDNTKYIVVNSGDHAYTIDVCDSISMCIQKHWIESSDIVIFDVDYKNISSDMFLNYENTTDLVSIHSNSKPLLTIVNKNNNPKTYDNTCYDRIPNTSIVTMCGKTNIIGNIFDIRIV